MRTPRRVARVREMLAHPRPPGRLTAGTGGQVGRRRTDRRWRPCGFGVHVNLAVYHHVVISIGLEKQVDNERAKTDGARVWDAPGKDIGAGQWPAKFCRTLAGTDFERIGQGTQLGGHLRGNAARHVIQIELKRIQLLQLIANQIDIEFHPGGKITVGRGWHGRKRSGSARIGGWKKLHIKAGSGDATCRTGREGVQIHP